MSTDTTEDLSGMVAKLHEAINGREKRVCEISAELHTLLGANREDYQRIMELVEHINNACTHITNIQICDNPVAAKAPQVP